MKYIVAIITVLAIFNCKPKDQRKDIEIVFSPGLVEFNNMNTEVINSIKHPDETHRINSSDYSFLQSVLSSPKKEIKKEAIPPLIWIKLDTITYAIGVNRVIKSNDKHYSISEKEMHRVKCIIHYYDFIDKANLLDMKEIKAFGMPNNYNYSPSDPHKPTKPLVKLILKEE